MDDTEKQLFSSYKSVFIETVDPIAITDGLYQIGHLTTNQRLNIYKISDAFSNRSNVWKALFLLIPPVCKLKHFIQVLLNTGYTEISMEISEKLRMASPKSRNVCRLYRTKTGESCQRFAQKLFMNFKINTHNNAFIDPRKYAHGESQKYKIQFERFDADDEEMKRGIADKYVACLLSEIDSHIMLYSRNFPAKNLLKELNRMIPETSDSNITELSYNSRVAMTYALAGKDDESEEHLQNAMSVSILTGRCVEISNLFYIYVFNLLCRYEKYPTRSLRDKIIHIAELGLLSTDQEDNSIREFWTRIFVLRIVYCLLALSFRGDPIYYIKVDKHSILKAKKLLTEIDRLWRSIESRRKIMYYVAKARITELERYDGYHETAMYFLQQAIDICNEGRYGETEYVKQYASYFRPGTDENSACHPKFTLIENRQSSSENAIVNANKKEVIKRSFDTETLEMSCRYDDGSDTKIMSVGTLKSDIDDSDYASNESTDPKLEILDHSGTGQKKLKSVDELKETFGIIRISNEGEASVDEDNDTILKELNISKVEQFQPHSFGNQTNLNAVSFHYDNSDNVTNRLELPIVVDRHCSDISNTYQSQMRSDTLHGCKPKYFYDSTDESTNTAIKTVDEIKDETSLLKTIDDDTLHNGKNKYLEYSSYQSSNTSVKTAESKEGTSLKTIYDESLFKSKGKYIYDSNDDTINTSLKTVDDINDGTSLKSIDDDNLNNDKRKNIYMCDSNDERICTSVKSTERIKDETSLKTTDDDDDETPLKTSQKSDTKVQETTEERNRNIFPETLSFQDIHP